MSRIFTSFLISSFLTTAFFCSCVGSVENSISSNVHHGDVDNCDSSQGRAHHSSEKHCDCYLVKMVNVDIASKTVLVMPANGSQQPFIPNKFFLNKNITLKHNLAYIHGPPGLIVVVPLYIQFHSLRI